MTTCREIVTLALRRARIVGIGRTPRASESDDALTALQGYYDGLFAHGAFSSLEQIYKDVDYTAGVNERIIADNATITIPDLIDGVPPADLSAVIVITDTTQKNYVFSLGRWQVCDSLTLDNTAPLANRDKEGLACSLALEIAENYGASVTPRVFEKANRFNSSLLQWQNMTFERGVQFNTNETWSFEVGA
jgi:hypothetical protein